MDKLANLEHVSGLGWHDLRRKFATDLSGASLKHLSRLGGWKDPQTILKCYQSAAENRCGRRWPNGRWRGAPSVVESTAASHSIASTPKARAARPPTSG
ncbi:MAG: hypothetical protein M8835_13000 [marine benthic group bacterium]|nr:hypothetical protein [Gemmatimonadota bacterium]MCL7975459.1 hypothetical protein [Gemmatimonadota bacterium]